MQKGRKKRQTGLTLVLIVVLMAFGIFLFNGNELKKKRESLLAKQQEYEELIELQKERAALLSKRQAYMQTTRYIEETARAKLGLVFPDEIIFREEKEDE